MLSSPLDYLDQCGHVGDFIEGWGLQLGQQGADLLFGNAIEDSFHASQPACGRFQNVEDPSTPFRSDLRSLPKGVGCRCLSGRANYRLALL